MCHKQGRHVRFARFSPTLTRLSYADAHENLTSLFYYSFICYTSDIYFRDYFFFGLLGKRVFDCRELTVKTKVKVYDQCIIPLLLYGSETWPLYQKHLKQLRTIQQRHLRSILRIKWDHFVLNEEVLERANVLDMEIKLLKKPPRLDGSYMSYERYQTSESTAIWRVGRF